MPWLSSGAGVLNAEVVWSAVLGDAGWGYMS